MSFLRPDSYREQESLHPNYKALVSIIATHIWMTDDRIELYYQGNLFSLKPNLIILFTGMSYEIPKNQLICIYR